ncbi:MAG: DUF692 domain-containing protein [Verrucomicrobiae bacterium]|nr:DUF692 domain-containing protein [Verrucomicrobiae bacterium]
MTASRHDRPRGAGIAYRYSIHDEIMQHRDRIDLLEISTEDYIVRERRLGADAEMRLLGEALDQFPGVAHGISLSLGTVEPPPEWYLRATNRFLEDSGLRIFSEHLAFHSVDGNDLTMFLGMPFTEESVRWIASKYEAVKASLGRPFALENVTYLFPVPHCPLDEAIFFRRICEETDASLLLDVTNLFNNSQNHGYDVGEFLDRYPLERVSQIHLAGGFLTDQGTWEDSHSEPVMEPVWELYEEVIRRTNCEIVILERDSKFHPFEKVVADVDRAREVFWRCRDAEADFVPKDPFHGVADSLISLNPDVPEFAQLKGFQRAMMARITSGDYRAFYAEDPQRAAADVGLTDETWRKRLAHCDLGSMDRLAKSWTAILKQEDEVQSAYESSEWAAWAELLDEPDTVASQ